MSVSGHFVGLVLKGLTFKRQYNWINWTSFLNSFEDPEDELANVWLSTTQLIIICSKSTIETLEKSLEYVQS